MTLEEEIAKDAALTPEERAKWEKVLSDVEPRHRSTPLAWRGPKGKVHQDHVQQGIAEPRKPKPSLDDYDRRDR